VGLDLRGIVLHRRVDGVPRVSRHPRAVPRQTRPDRRSEHQPDLTRNRIAKLVCGSRADPRGVEQPACPRTHRLTVGLTCESTISGCNEGIANGGTGNVHTWLRGYMLRRSDWTRGTAARQCIPWDQTVTAGPDATQRGPALGLWPSSRRRATTTPSRWAGAGS